MGRGFSDDFNTVGTRSGGEAPSPPALDISKDLILEREDIKISSYEEEKQIMIDVDNTLFPLLRGIMALEPELSRVSLSSDPLVLGRQLRALGHDLDQLLDRLYHDADLMKSIGTFAGAREALNNLRDHGIRLHIVSSRPETSDEDLREFLLDMGIPYDTIALGIDDKLSYCQENNITTLVDDDPSLIQEAEAEGRDAISFDWEHAEKALRQHGGQEARDWREITHHALDAVSTNISRRYLRESEDPASLEMQAYDSKMMLQASGAGHSGTCLRRRVGAVIVDADGNLIQEGSNQAPQGAPSCEEDGCLTDEAGRCQRTVHAEASAIIAAPPGSLSGSTLYCTDRPCLGCAKLIAASGVRRVVYARPYHAESLEVDELFAALSIEVQEITTPHEDLNLPPSGAREGMVKPEEVKIS